MSRLTTPDLDFSPTFSPLPSDLFSAFNQRLADTSPEPSAKSGEARPNKT
jgi:hypothetical protein